jgi:hypothetical protein
MGARSKVPGLQKRCAGPCPYDLPDKLSITLIERKQNGELI